ELHVLSVLIDLELNLWSAAVDGVPIFVNETFNGTGLPRTLGPIAAEWQVAGDSPSSYGDNWMLVADFSIETVEAGRPPPVIDSLSRDANGNITLTWQAEPGFDYSVEYSH
ncbi:MAG: hypothetical protein GWO24_37405, partial [Akkermansiaceae bacterium]|nr:hypothetical protein [Akkermansiaceae bacterium]